VKIRLELEPADSILQVRVDYVDVIKMYYICQEINKMNYRNRTRPLSSRIGTYVIMACAVFSLCVSIALAGPEGAKVVNGQVSFQQIGYNTTITASNKAIINYSRFDIARPEIVQFIQPSTSASVLNRILSANPTVIDGTLLANGRVFFINPAGVIIGNGARINVNQLVASALNISDLDFINGRYNFAGGNGPVINQGAITAEKVYLIGKQVANSGTINCPAGYVIMTAGDRVFIGEVGSDVVVEMDVPSSPGSAEPIEGAAILNEGAVNVGEGTIILAAAGDIYSQAISNVGSLSASVQTGNAGQVKLAAADGLITNTGTIEAKSGSGAGGTAVVEGKDIINTGTIDVTGVEGGQVEMQATARLGQFGDVLADAIEGDGGSIDLWAGDMTVLGSSSLTTANGGLNGSGGEVTILSDKNTYFPSGAVIEAKGGTTGDGGFIEVSADEGLYFYGFADTSAASGKDGTILLDPRDITIQLAAGANDGEVADNAIDFDDGFPPITVDFTIGEAAVEALNGAITLQADRDFTVNGDVTLDLLNQAAGETVTFQAGHDMTIGGSITTNGGDIVLSAGDQTAPYSSNVDGRLTVAAALDTTNGGAVATDGSITLRAGDIALGANVTAGTNGAVNFYTNLATRTMSIGIGGSNYNVSDTELTNIQGAGTIRFGEQGAQSGAIMVQTATSPVAGAAIEINSNSSIGSVTFDDDGTATAFATGGAGNVTVRTGTGGIVNAGVTDNTYAEISTTGTITLTSAGAIGSSANRIEFADGQDDVVVTNAPGGVYFSGIGSLAMGAITTGGGLLNVSANDNITVNGAINTGAGSVYLDSDVTTIYLNNNISTSGADITFNDAVELGASAALSTGAGVGGNINFQSTVDGAYDLALDAGTGTTTFNAAVGNTTPIGDGAGAALAISTGTTVFESTLQATSGITKAGGAGAVTFKDDVTLGNGDTATNLAGTVLLDGLTFSGYDGLTFGTTTLSGGPVTLNSNGGSIQISSLTGGAQNLTLAAGIGGGTTTVTGAVTNLGTGTGAALTIENGVTGLVRFQQTVGANSGLAAAGATSSVRFDENVTLANGDTGTNLAGNVQLDGLTFSGYDGLIFGNTTLSGGPVTLNSNGSSIQIGTLTGAQNLTLAAGIGGGTTTVTGAVTNLGTGTGAALTIADGVTGLVRFQGTVGANSGLVAVGDTSSVRFDDNVTLANGDTGTSLPGNVQLDGLTFSGYDGITFGATTLSGGPVTLNSNGSGIQIGSLTGAQNLTLAAGIGAGTTTVTGAVTNLGTGVGAALTIENGVTGLVRFQGTVGANSGLVAAAGTSSVRFDQDVTLANGDTGTALLGYVQLDGLTFSGFDGLRFGIPTLSGGPVTLNSNGSSINIGFLDGAQNLTLAAGIGAGTTTVTGNVTNLGTGTGAALTVEDGVTGLVHFEMYVGANSGLVAAGATSNVRFDMGVTLANGDTGTNLPGNVQLDGLTFSGYDGLTFGATTLSGGPVTLNSNGSGIQIGSLTGAQNLMLAAGIGGGTTTVTGNVTNLGTGTGAALTIEDGVTGLVRFQGTVGANSGLVAAGATSNVRFDQDVTLANGDTGTSLPGNVQLDGLTFSGFDGLTFGATTLSGGPVTLNSNGSGIQIGSLTGAQNLTLAAGIGAGTTTVTGAVTNLGTGVGAALTIENGVTGLVRFQGTVGANSGLVAAAGTSSVRFDQDVTLANGDTGTSLPGNVQLDGLTFDGFDGVAFGATTLSGGPVVLNSNGSNIQISSLTGAQNLTLAAGIGVGTTTVTGNVTNLGTGTGAALTIADGVTGLVYFQQTVGANSGIVAAAATSNVRFDGDVTLANGDTGTSLPGNVQLDGLTFSGYDGITFGATTLSGGPVVLNSNGSNIQISSLTGAQNLTLAAGIGGGTTTVTGAVTNLGTGTGAALTIADGVTGLVRFQGTVGANSGLVAAAGTSSVWFDQDVTLANGDTGTSLPGNVQLDGLTFDGFDGITFGATTLSGGPVVLNSNGSDITLQSTLNGAQTLDITAGTGNILFDGIVGGGTPLDDVLIHSAVNVTVDEAFTAESFTQAAGSGTTTINGLLSTTENVDITTGAITFTGVGSINAGAGLWPVTLTAQTGAITDNTAAETANIIASTAVLDASTGIGSAAVDGDIETTITNLEADTQTGGIYVTDTAGGLTIGGIGAMVGAQITAAGTDIVIVAQSPLTVDELVEGPDDITLTAGDSVAAGDDLTLNADVTSRGTGTITLNAGDDIIQTNSYTVQVTGGVGQIVATADTEGDAGADGDTAGFTQTDGASFVSGGGPITVSSYGDATISLLNAGTTGTVNVTSTGGAIDSVADDGVADIVGNIINLTAAVGGIGNTSVLEVTAATQLNADTVTGDDSDIQIDSIGDATVGLISAGTGDVTLDSTGDIDSTTDDGTADIVGATVNLIAAVGGIGNDSVLDVTATTELNADTDTGDDSDIQIDSIGNLSVGLITAGIGGGNVTLDSTGNIIDVTTSENANIVGATVTLTAETGIGASDIETSATTISAGTTDGDVDIHNTHASDVTVTSLTTGSGDILFSQDGGGDLTVNTATTVDGSIWIDATEGIQLTGGALAATGIIDVRSRGDLTATNTSTITDNGTYDGTIGLPPNTDDRPSIDFLDESSWGFDAGDPFDLAIYLASQQGNVTVDSGVSIAAGRTMVMDADSTVTFGATFEGSTFVATNRLEACSRISETLGDALNLATLPYVNEFASGTNPPWFTGDYVLRGGTPDAWVLQWTLPVMVRPPIAFDLIAFGPEWNRPVLVRPPFTFDLIAYGPKRRDVPDVPKEAEADLEGAYLHSTDVLRPPQP
jgi:filamentous hemagglutinin family protein